MVTPTSSGDLLKNAAYRSIGGLVLRFLFGPPRGGGGGLYLPYPLGWLVGALPRRLLSRSFLRLSRS